jgi:ribosomal protein L24E
MKALLFIGTVRELRELLRLCRTKEESIVTYARKHGPRRVK